MATGPTKPMYKRILVVLCAFVFLGFSVLIGRLAKLQIIDYKEYQKKAIEQQTGIINIAPKRGTIYDRNMKPLAVSASAYMVYVSPAVMTDKQKEAIIEKLPDIIEVSEEKVSEACNNKKSYYIVLARKMEKDVADKVRQLILDEDLYTCLAVAEDPKRYYSYNNLASQVLGFVGTDNQGLLGIEAKYDSYLKGTPGRIVTARNSIGMEMPFDYEMFIEPQDGCSLVLTLDEVIQHFVEKQLETFYIEGKVDKYANCIVMNVKTGEILAMASKPDFDLNSPFALSEKQKAYIESLDADKQSKARNDILNELWRNKTISDPYEPGSVFKLITAATAREENLVKLNDTFYCPGHKTIAGVRIRCARRQGHGSETFIEGLANSCNVVFMTVGEKLGAGLLSKYTKKFGFGEKTGIDLPGEALGILHDESEIGPVELATMSFGQTFKATPIQIITAVAAISNGGYLLTPRVVREIVDANGNIVENFDSVVRRQVLSKQTSDDLRMMMEQVVLIGTGRNAKMAGYNIGGKTGTSEKTDARNEQGLVDKYVYSFVGVAPIDDPEIAILVSMDEAYLAEVGSLWSAPRLVRAMMEDILPYIGLEPELSENDVQKEIVLDNYVGKDTEEVKQLLKEKNLKYKIIGEEGAVKYQLPLKGQKIPEGGTVMLYTSSIENIEEVEVPNLIEMTIEEARSALTKTGLNIKLKENYKDFINSFISDQYPAPGTKLKPGDSVTIEISYRDS